MEWAALDAAMEPTGFWALFWTIVVVMLVLDLGVFHRHARVISLREALGWVAVWVSIGLAFCGAIYLFMDDGPHKAKEFLTCYVTEEALSVDNIFVFVVIFRYFSIPAESQHRVLFWGILGAIVMRGLFIWLGVELTERFAWTLYVLGAFLVLTGARLAFEKEREVHPDKNPVLRLARRLLPVTPDFVGSRFFVRREGRLVATPLFLALLVVETTDVLFAVDSVPAALGITSDRLILYSSNVLAVMGLRALYFAVAGAVRALHYLQAGLSAILVFVGFKMLLAHHYKIPVDTALSVVLGILAVSVVASLVRAR